MASQFVSLLLLASIISRCGNQISVLTPNNPPTLPVIQPPDKTTPCSPFEPNLNQSLEPLANQTYIIDVKINNKIWRNWGNGVNLTSIDNPLFIQSYSMIRYQRCPGQSCGHEIAEVTLSKGQGISNNQASTLENFKFKIPLPDSLINKLQKSKRGQLVYAAENIYETDEACKIQNEITGFLLEDDEFYGRYRLDSTKYFKLSVIEFDPEQQIMAIQFDGSFYYDKTGVDQAFIPKVTRLYEPNITSQIYARFRYIRQNER